MPGPPLHVHPAAADSFEVIAGTPPNGVFKALAAVGTALRFRF